MMPFLDWFGFLGTGIQSLFAWATFHRDAFVDNVGWRQQQKYQQKNYQIGWTAIARDDVRDLMGISVTRINNYMIVGTLIMSISASFLMTATFGAQCPDFVVNAFYVSICSSIIFLGISILFGVKGQNCAFTETMKLLTFQIRPEDPADYNHDYMKQAQWIEMNGIRGIFRIPGLLPDYDTTARNAPQRHAGLVTKPSSTATSACSASSSSAEAYQQDESKEEENFEDLTPLESLVRGGNQLWYLSKFGRFMKLWLPYDTCTKYTMGLGIITLGHGMSYYSLGKLIYQRKQQGEWAACSLTAAFSYMIVLAVGANFQTIVTDIGVRLFISLLLIGGPTAGAVGVVTTDLNVRLLMVPCFFFLHFLFWAVWAYLTRNGIPNDRLLDFENLTGDYWSDQAHSNGPGELFWEEGTDKLGGGDGCGGNGLSKPVPPPVAGSCGAATPDAGSGAEPPAGTGSSTGLAAAKWPTDYDAFEEKVFKTRNQVHMTLRRAILTSALLWFSLFIWALSYLGPQAQRSGGSAVFKMQDVPVEWPSPFFRPHAIACAGGRAFLADRFHIYELSVHGGPMRWVPCGLRSTVVSIGASCNASGHCGPLALVPGRADHESMSTPMQVVDCMANEVSPLLREGRPAEHLGVIALAAHNRGNSTQGREIGLLAVHAGEVVRYNRAWPRNDAWEPLSRVGYLGGPDLRALGAADGGSLLLFFRSVRRETEAAPATAEVEARDRDSMEAVGSWALPLGTKPLASGCALVADSGSVEAHGGSMEALVLLEAGAPDEPPPRLARLTLLQ